MKRIQQAFGASFIALFLGVGAVCVPAHGAGTDALDSPAEMMTRIEGRQSPNRQGLDSLTLQDIMREYHVPGVSVAVIRDFKIHLAKGYGVADVETGRPVEPTTLFQAASISKPVTAMALLKLAQKGYFPLDTDINGSLTSWKIPAGQSTSATPVTARALLSHTSEAADGFGFPGYHPSEPRPTLVQILEGAQPSNVGPVSFERAPFTAYRYSGGGLVILLLAMTDVLGKPFVGLAIDDRGEGWYFSHGGSNWGFLCKLSGHLRKGYGVVVMTNADNGAAVITEIEARSAAAYSWDSLDKPVPRE